MFQVLTWFVDDTLVCATYYVCVVEWFDVRLHCVSLLRVN